MENPEGSAFQISSTVRALSSALRGESRSAAGSEAPVVGVSSSSVRGGCPWFKESSAKNLRSRDFIAPSAVLNKLFPEGQVNSNSIAIIKKTVTASVPYNTSSHAEQRLRCAPHSKRQLSLHHAKRGRFCVWMSLASGKVFQVRVDLGRLVKERGLLGFDPNLGSCLVQERCVAHLAELQGALSRCERHLVVGPVTATGLESRTSASQYLQLRGAQMRDASVMKYGPQGEWQLLFNYIIPFGELLDQSGQTLRSSTGVRITLGTEAVCKFLVSLSMDFSSYYNRVHILGVSVLQE
ncbi:UNVERIFIED_CONTAM: hypothetical protein FKN15_027733 [Acipenser sinensis]